MSVLYRPARGGGSFNYFHLYETTNVGVHMALHLDNRLLNRKSSSVSQSQIVNFLISDVTERGILI